MKKFTRIVSFASAAVVMLANLRVVNLSELTDVQAADAMTAFEITENMQIGWNLGNTFDAYASDAKGNVLETAGLETETCWGQPQASQEMFDAIQEKGFNTIRIPTTWFQHLDEEDNIDPEWMARVHEVVDYAYKKGMYVILNVHHEETWVNRPDLGTAYDEMKPRLTKIWEQIATEFADYDQHLIFETMNEPRAKGTDHEWWGPTQAECDTINKLNADAVDVIRSVESPYKDTRLIMIPGYCASSDVSMMSKVEIPEGDAYIAASVHAYSPYDFSMNASVKDHSVFTAKYSTELAGILDGIRKTFLDKDIPVVIGEFGTSNFDNTEARCDWATQYITTTKKYGIPCVLWDNDARGNKDVSERHDYMNRKTLEWYEDSVQVVDTMMTIINDDSVVWGSERKAPEIEHADLSTGDNIFEGPAELDASVKDGNCTPGLNVTWADLDGKDVAVEYTGDTPVIALTNGDWENWTEVKPYDIDEEKGIAYYSYTAIAAAWGEDAVDEIEHLFVRTNSTTTVENIYIIEASGAVVDTPAPTAKIYTLDLTDADREGELIVKIVGEPNIATNGCLGYMGEEEWEQIEWEGKTDADGNLVVKIKMSDVPASVTKPQFQIWLNFEKLDMESCEVVPASHTEQPTDPTDVFPIPVYGDANCDGQVTMADAAAILQFLGNSQKYPLTDEGQINADVDGSAGITTLDAIVIQKAVAGFYEFSDLPLAK